MRRGRPCGPDGAARGAVRPDGLGWDAVVRCALVAGPLRGGGDRRVGRAGPRMGVPVMLMVGWCRAQRFAVSPLGARPAYLPVPLRTGARSPGGHQWARTCSDGGCRPRGGPRAAERPCTPSRSRERWCAPDGGQPGQPPRSGPYAQALGPRTRDDPSGAITGTKATRDGGRCACGVQGAREAASVGARAGGQSRRRGSAGGIGQGGGEPDPSGRAHHRPPGAPQGAPGMAEA